MGVRNSFGLLDEPSTNDGELKVRMALALMN